MTVNRVPPPRRVSSVATRPTPVTIPVNIPQSVPIPERLLRAFHPARHEPVLAHPLVSDVHDPRRARKGKAVSADAPGRFTPAEHAGSRKDRDRVDQARAEESPQRLGTPLDHQARNTRRLEPLEQWSKAHLSPASRRSPH